MRIIDGKEISRNIIERLKKLPKSDKFLAAILIGDDPASASFIKRKRMIAEELGIGFSLLKMAETVMTEEVVRAVKDLADDEDCGGIIVQLPVPEGIDVKRVLAKIPKEKDVDVLDVEGIGEFYMGFSEVEPPAVGTLKEILMLEANGNEKEMGEILRDSRVAIVGLGALVGKPIANWIMRKAKETYLLRRGSDLSILKTADIVVCAAGQKHLIRAEMLKDGATVIDFGYATDECGKLFGDFNIHEAETMKCATPTPGGTGPILVAKLFDNFYRLNG
jgi:methylenetetrahydrofolate dehydrogenase (NADP+)/methenyltetrahydrofolate cyclohydrolase